MQTHPFIYEMVGGQILMDRRWEAERARLVARAMTGLRNRARFRNELKPFVFWMSQVQPRQC